MDIIFFGNNSDIDIIGITLNISVETAFRPTSKWKQPESIIKI